MSSTHALFSPSSANKWLNCPGSTTMEADYPRIYSPYADEGSAAHYLAAHCLKTGTPLLHYLDTHIVNWHTADQDTQSFFGAEIPEDAEITSRWEVSAEMIDNLQTYVDCVLNAQSAFIASGTLFIEQKVSLERTLSAPVFGTCDAIIINEWADELTIIDLKYGRSPVYATNNTQLLLYALGAIETFDAVFDFSKLNKIKLVICQPRLDMIDIWETTPAHLNIFTTIAKTAVQAAGEAITSYPSLLHWQKRFLHPTEAGCKWCRAAANCPALAATNVSMISNTNDFDNLDNVESAIETGIANIPNLDWETVVKLFSASKQIKHWLEAIEARMFQELIIGNSHPDWKLVNGRPGNRKWENLTAAENLMKRHNILQDQRYEKTLISPTTAEKQFKYIHLPLWEKLQKHISRPPAHICIAPATDKREPSPRPNLRISLTTGENRFD